MWKCDFCGNEFKDQHKFKICEKNHKKCLTCNRFMVHCDLCKFPYGLEKVIVDLRTNLSIGKLKDIVEEKMLLRRLDIAYNEIMQHIIMIVKTDQMVIPRVLLDVVKNVQTDVSYINAYSKQPNFGWGWIVSEKEILPIRLGWTIDLKEGEENGKKSYN